MSLAGRGYGTGGAVTGNVTKREQQKRPTAPPRAMVTVTPAERDMLMGEIEKLRAEVAELRAMVTARPTSSEKPTKRDRATYMREYRKREALRKAQP